MKSSIGTKLTLSYVLFSFFAVVVLETLFGMAVYQYYLTGMEQTLSNNAQAAVSMINKYAPAGNIEDKKKFIFDNMDSQEDALVEVYDLTGKMLINNRGDSDSAVELTEDYKQALEGEENGWCGKIGTHERIMSVSVPIYDGEKIVGVLRYISSMTEAYSTMQSTIFGIVVLGCGILLIALVIGKWMSRRILTPIRNLTKVTREIAGGNLDVKATVYNKDEIGRLSEAVNQMTDEIALSYKAKNDFISSISHELRTPLTSINGWAETISDATDDEETVKMGLDIISRETKRMIGLVNDLLDFSKLQSHRMELDLAPMWLNGFLEGAYHQFLPRATQNEVSLRLHLDSVDVKLMADEFRLSQVVGNIMDNAFKFVTGRAAPEIIIQTHMLDDQVVITIEDNGPGMSSGDLMRVKEKFYKGSSKQSGTGLGLSIVNEIVALHKGTFYIDSIRGVGTKVSVVLPFEETEVDDENLDMEDETVFIDE